MLVHYLVTSVEDIGVVLAYFPVIIPASVSLIVYDLLDFPVANGNYNLQKIIVHY